MNTVSPQYMDYTMADGLNHIHSTSILSHQPPHCHHLYIVIIGYRHCIGIGCIVVITRRTHRFGDIVSAERTNLLHRQPLIHTLCMKLVLTWQDPQLVIHSIWLHANGTRWTIIIIILFSIGIAIVDSAVQIRSDNLASR